MMDAKYHEELWDLIKDIKVAMMVSHDGQHMRSRPMYTVQDDFDGALWFFTDVTSGKVDEILLNEDVCIVYADPNEDHYVSISGTASLIRDRALINQLWSPFVAAWFPEGRESDSVGLIEVTVNQAEIWDRKTNKMVSLFELAKANIMGSKPDIGEHRHLG